MSDSGKRHARPWIQPALELAGLLLIALVMRAGYIEQSGFGPDLQAIEQFGRAAQEGGLFSIYGRPPRQDYPPLPMVVLWAGFSVQEEVSGLSTMTVLKALPIAGDIALIVLAYAVFRRRRWGLRLGIPLTLAVLPGVVATSAFWGQFDSTWVACMVLSAYLLKQRRFSLAWIAFALGLLIKPQVIVFAPVLGLYTLLIAGWRGVLRGAVWSGLLFVGVLLPFIIGSGLEETLRPFTSSVGRFPDMTRNALNLWMLGGVGAGLPLYAPNYPVLTDAAPLAGPLNGRQAGLLMLGLYVLLLVAVMVRQRHRERIFLWAGAVNFAFFMFSTQMHERYIYPAAILALFAIAEDRRMIWVALPLAVTFSYNIIAITTAPFVWLGVNLWYYAGEAGLFVAALNGLILVVWTWFLLTPEPLAQPRPRRAETLLKAVLAASLAGLLLFMALPDPLPQMTALDARFDNGARLLGYELNRGTESMEVTLFWANSGPIPEELAVFVHVLADGERAAGDDQIPAVPSHHWALGQIVTTRHVFDTRGLNPDAVSLAAGLYTLYNMERVGAVQDGIRVPESLIRLDSPASISPPA